MSTTEQAASIELIDPATATSYLQANTRNRHLQTKYVNRLAGAMERGEWQFNADPIRFSDTGVLLDGQHRLAAVVQSEMTVPMLVVRGLVDESQTTMDTGNKRTFAHFLSMAGETNVYALAAAVRWTWVYETQDGNLSTRSNAVPTVQQLMQTLEQHPGLRDSVRTARSVRKQVRSSQGLLAALHHIFESVDADDANDFFDRLRTGEQLPEGSPILILRKALITDSLKPSTTPPDYHAAWIIKSFNAYRLGRDIRSIIWRKGGASAEPFPRIVSVP